MTFFSTSGARVISVTMAKSLAPLAECVHTFAPANPRALNAADYASAFEKCGVTAHAHASAHEALASAIASAKEKNLPLIICGSLYSYAEIRTELDKLI